MPIPGAVWIPVGGGGGSYALIDEADFEWLSKFTWFRAGLDGRYAMTELGDGNRIFMHRLLLSGTVEVDHKNGNTLDNRKSNLRSATREQQGANSAIKQNKTGYKGVYKNGSGWAAEIIPNKKKKYLGTFRTLEEAALTYDKAARELFGEFACVNFPREGERGARRG